MMAMTLHVTRPLVEEETQLMSTPRDTVLAALRHQTPDHVPYEIPYGSFTPALFDVFVAETGATDPAEYFRYPLRPVQLRAPTQTDLWRTYARYYARELPVGTTISAWGVAETPGSLAHFVDAIHPLRNATTVEQIVDYPMPDPATPAYHAHLKNAVDALHRRGLAAKGELSQTIFETAWYIRGLEQTLTDMVERPDITEALFDRLTAIRVVQARQMAAAGVDILRLGDDVSGQLGMLMSPATWRRWLKPRLAQVIAAAKTIKPDIHIGYHSDGDCRAVIPELIEIGVDALNPIQPECMDPAAIKRQYGKQLTLWGTIGTQTTMSFATPDEVRALVKERIAALGVGGGLILAPTHILEPEVPWPNIIAFFNTIEEFGGQTAG